MNKTSEGSRPAVDYEVTIDMAEQICMIQRTEKGNMPTQKDGYTVIDIYRLKAYNKP